MRFPTCLGKLSPGAEAEMIPLCDPKQQYLELKKELDAAMLDVAASGHYILGPHVCAFEQEMAAYCGVEYAIGVNSGTDALHLALRALDIAPGDEVITTPFTFIATTEAIAMVGATPVFVDIDRRSFNIDPDLIEAAITPRTRAILPVHVFGQTCDMRAIMEIADRHGLYVVEDCAQALGASTNGRRVGAFGVAGCVSFFPSKNLGCFGDGGMVLTNDRKLCERIESLRRHGGKVKYYHDELGLNSRLDEMQAGILRVKLPYLDRWNRQRREKARFYDELLAQIPELELPVVAAPAAADSETELDHVFHQYTVRLERRDEVKAAMHDRGVQCFPYYPKCLHLQVAHANLPYHVGSFPVAERASQTCMSLPIYPELEAGNQRYVVESLSACVTERVQRKAG